MNRAIRIIQSLAQLFVGISAAICGVLLFADPIGAIFRFPPHTLDATPFTDFTIPGIILFLVNGVGQLVAAVLTLRHHRRAGLVGAIFGLGLMIWIFVQVNMIGGRDLLQYSYFGLGVIETALAFLIQTAPAVKGKD